MINRAERRRAESVRRKIRALPPAARELAIATGMELHDSYTEFNDKRIEERIDQLYNEVEAEVHGRMRQQFAAFVREALQATDLGRALAEAEEDAGAFRRHYLRTWLEWFASGGDPRPGECLSVPVVINLALDEFTDRLDVLRSRVAKDAEHFRRPEQFYGALRWLATTYIDSKTGIAPCPELDASCRAACGFRYIAHQSDVTMGMYASNYRIQRRGRTVQLREHLAFGNAFDPRHTIRIAWFVEDGRVIVGYVGQHQATRAS
jgi:hypothetical protein